MMCKYNLSFNFQSINPKTFLSFIGYGFLFLAIAVSGIRCKKTEIETAKEPNHSTDTHFLSKQQIKALGIRMGRPEIKNLSSVVEVNGLLNIPPQNRASVSSPLNAVVKRIAVVQTQEVKKGQLLAVLEHQDVIKMQEEFLSSISLLDLYEKELERQIQLGSVAALRDVQTARTQLNQLKAKIQSLKNQLSILNLDPDKLAQSFIIEPDFKLLSPISGNVALIGTGIGAFVRAETELFQIIDNAHIHADMMVFEKDIFKIKVGQKVKFVLTNLDNKTIEGTIFGIGKVFEPDTKTIAVHAEIPHNEKYGLVPGMYLNAQIETQLLPQYVLPLEATALHESNRVCFELQDSTEEGYYFKIQPLPIDSVNSSFIAGVSSQKIYVLNNGFEFLSSILSSQEGEANH
jgi:cobalt-zinc-cadmium efflux system membrane fusion protein